MHYSRARVSVAASGLIILTILALLAVGLRTASAAPPASHTAATDLGWGRVFNNGALFFCVVLGNSWDNQVFVVEVVDISQDADPGAVDASEDPNPKTLGSEAVDQGGLYPVNQVVCFDIENVPSNPVELRVNLLDADLAIIGVSESIDSTGGTPDNADADNTDAITPTPTPAAVPSAPATPVATVIVPESEVTLVPAPEGGVSIVVQPDRDNTLTSLEGDVTVLIPHLAIAETGQLEFKPVALAAAPAAPPGSKLVKAFELNFFDFQGSAKTIRFFKAVTITVNFTDADVAAVGGEDPSILTIMVYNASNNVWLPLRTAVNFSAKTLTADVFSLSLFGVGSQPPITPSVGDWSPSSGLLLGVALGGAILAIAGAYFIVQSRRQRAG